MSIRAPRVVTAFTRLAYCEVNRELGACASSNARYRTDRRISAYVPSKSSLSEHEVVAKVPGLNQKRTNGMRPGATAAWAEGSLGDALREPALAEQRLFGALRENESLKSNHEHMAIKTTAQRRRQLALLLIRAEDIASRYGGNEFVGLLSNLDDATIAGKFAERIRKRIGECYSIGGMEIDVGAAIGLAAYPDGRKLRWAAAMHRRRDVPRPSHSPGHKHVM